jgi:Citrate lyase beta subunit
LTAFIDYYCFPARFVLPIVDSAGEVTLFEYIISDYYSDIELFIVIETPASLSYVDIIFYSSNIIPIVKFCSADFTSQTSSILSLDSLLYARSKIVNSAGISGVSAIDGVWPDFKDEKGLIEETQKIVDIGFKGKMAIHPNQISGIHEAFVPEKEEVQFARDVIDAYEAAKGGLI